MATPLTTTVEQVCGRLAEIAPLKLAEEWDNVGLLVGNRRANVQRVMTCLTITPAVANEAVEKQVDLLISHHPLPFKPLGKLTSDSVPGRILLRLIEGKVAVYSAHTAFDTAAEGINAMWAAALQLQSVEPLLAPTPIAMTVASGTWGAGRQGKLKESMTLGDLAVRAGRSVGQRYTQIVGEQNREVTKIAIACGSGGSFLAAASRNGCHCLVTGEATFHTSLEAEALGIGLVLLGHYASERFAMERLAGQLRADFPMISCLISERDLDPLQLIDCQI